MVNRNQTFNELPALLPAAEVETEADLKKAIAAMRNFYRGFMTEDARALGFTLDDLRAWKPAVVAAKRGRRRAS